MSILNKTPRFNRKQPFNPPAPSSSTRKTPLLREEKFVVYQVISTAVLAVLLCQHFVCILPFLRLKHMFHKLILSNIFYL